MELILIRHARPIRLRSVDGRPADPPLSEEGQQQAAAMAEWLAHERIDRLYSSPMRRALETAQPLADAARLDVEVEPRIAEYDRNADFYIPLEELKATDYAAWKSFVQGGYDEGRDLEAFRREVVAGMDDIIAANPGKRVAAVCHGGVINAWAIHLLRIEGTMFFGAEYTSFNRFMAASTGERSVASLNETPHLHDAYRLKPE